MSRSSGPWRVDLLEQQLQGMRPGLRVFVVPVIDSTNSALLRAARDPLAAADPGLEGVWTPPCLLVAQTQTAGRGRQGRTWVSDAGEDPHRSLTFSLSIPLPPASTPGLSLAVGVSLAEALDPARPGQPARMRLKWPNDVWLADAGAPGGGRKLGGILVETQGTAAGRVAVIGVGLNIRPLDVADASTGVAAWSEIEADAQAPAALHRVAPALLQALDRFEREGLAPFLPAFAARDALRGRPVVTTLASSPLGWAEGIDHEGRLQLRVPGGELVAVASGEVSIRPAAGGTPPSVPSNDGQGPTRPTPSDCVRSTAGHPSPTVSEARC